MSYIEMPGLDTLEDVKVAPEDRYSLVIKDVDEYVKEEHNGEGGNTVIALTIGFDGHDEYQTFRHYLSMPGPNDSPEKAMTKARMLKRFLKLADIPFSSDGFDTQELMGARFDANVGLETVTDMQGNERMDDSGMPLKRNTLRVPKFSD